MICLRSCVLISYRSIPVLQASLVSRLFHYECARILYRTIPRMSLKSSVQAICALARSAKLASLVRSYTITLKQGDPTGNLYRLLSTALSQMINLHSLSFEIPGEHLEPTAFVCLIFSSPTFRQQVLDSSKVPGQHSLVQNIIGV